MDKVVAGAAEAVADIPDGASLAVGGFGPCGVPDALIRALLATGSRDLEIVSNNCGYDDYGLGRLIVAGRIVRARCSYMMGGNSFERAFLNGRVEVELMPQGTLAERLRAGGAGIPAFYTPAGIGTELAEGGLPLRYDGSGRVVAVSAPKEIRRFAGRAYLLENAITTDFALVHAAVGDRHGNLAYAAAARNFNPLCAAAARVTIAEVESLVEPGVLDPDRVDTPGVLVSRVVHVGAGGKYVERRTTRPRGAPATPAGAGSEGLS